MGFTLIELFFITIVLGFIVFVSVPSFRKSFDKLKAEQAAFKIVQSLRCSRVLAVSRARAVEWNWNSENKKAHLMGSDEGGSSESEESLGKCAVKLDETMTLARDGDRSGDFVIGFFPDGTSQDSRLFVLDSGRLLYKIEVDGATSQVSLKRAGLPSH